VHPVLVSLGSIEIRFYGLMYVIAILVGSRLILSEVKRKEIKLTPDDVMNFVVWMVAGGVIVARIYYVAFNWEFYSKYLKEIPAVWHGGLAIHGGIIGGLLGGYLFLKRKQVKFWSMADCVAPAGILGQAFGRFGNFMNGDAHGMPTTLPWGVVFPAGSIAGDEYPGIPLHPVMLYELLINFSIFLFLWLKIRKQNNLRKDGFVFALYIALYSAGRLFVETFRADSLMLGPLKAAQIVSIALILAVVAVIFWKRLWKRDAA